MWKKSSVLVAVGIASLACLNGVQSSGLFLSESQSDVEVAFVQFIAKYGKSYGSKNDLDMRFENFKRAYNLINEHNSQADIAYSMAINKFADMSPSEITTGLKINTADIKPFDRKYNLEQSATGVDWSKTVYVAPVLDQQTCGSCWAFAAANCIESAISIQKKISATNHIISVQQMLDCDI